MQKKLAQIFEIRMLKFLAIFFIKFYISTSDWNSNSGAIQASRPL